MAIPTIAFPEAFHALPLRTASIQPLVFGLCIALTACGEDGVTPLDGSPGQWTRVGYAFITGADPAEREGELRAVSIENPTVSMIHERFLLWPSTSSTGRKLVGGRNNALTVLDLQSGSERVVTTAAAEGTDIRADWSPDDSHIVFHALDEGSLTWDLFIIDTLIGSPPVQIVDGFDPIWSPVHDSVAFTGLIDGVLGLGLVGTDGGPPRLISPQTDRIIIPYDWSSDGRFIVGTRNASLFVLSRDGSELRQITFPPDSTVDSWAQWSPDDQFIAFIRTRTAHPSSDEIMIVDPDGGEPISLLSACRPCGEEIRSLFLLP